MQHADDLQKVDKKDGNFLKHIFSIGQPTPEFGCDAQQHRETPFS